MGASEFEGEDLSDFVLELEDGEDEACGVGGDGPGELVAEDGEADAGGLGFLDDGGGDAEAEVVSVEVHWGRG